jgi:hypothetical protein
MRNEPTDRRKVRTPKKADISIAEPRSSDFQRKNYFYNFRKVKKQLINLFRRVQKMGSSFTRPTQTLNGKDHFPSEAFSTAQPLLRFYVLSDFGDDCAEVVQVAAAMNRMATEFNSPPEFIVGLGDNFYPDGVRDENDRQFETIWRSIFLKNYPSLRVPWRMSLGNHDYMGNPDGQVAYHSNQRLNNDKLWYMPAKFYKFCYQQETTTTVPKEKAFNVDFFAIDTNGCQDHVIDSFPETPQTLRKGINVLKTELSHSMANWKIVFGHHPMYTQGRAHSVPGDFLREATSQYYGNQMFPGFDLEKVVLEGKVDCYLAGHEHCFQVRLLFFLSLNLFSVCIH